MCIFLYNFCFSINYKCNFGEYIAILGNIPELGCWELSKAIEMQWTEGDQWKKYMSFKQNNTTTVQYKYLVCCKNNDKIEIVRWEEGPNRKMNLKDLTKLFISINDSWERRKLSFLVKDTYNVYDNLYIIGRLASLGGMTTPKEMKKISIFCPFEKGFQTYWHFEALVPVFDTTKSKLVFNYLTMNKECKCWELVGNETSVKITTEDEDFGRHSWENCSSSNESLWQNKGKLKKNSKNIKKFHSDYLLKLEKNEFQVIQDVQELLADHGHNYQLNEFLFAGLFSQENLRKAINQENVKKILVFTNLKRVNTEEGTKEIMKAHCFQQQNIEIEVLDLNQSKESQMKWCASFVETAMKRKEKTLICWGNSKYQAFKALIEYFCNFKKFSLEAAKKFLKMSSSHKSFKRRTIQNKNIVLSR